MNVEDSNDNSPRVYKSCSMFWSMAIVVIRILVATLVVTVLYHNRSKRRSEDRQRRRIVVLTELIASSFSHNMVPKSSSDTRPLNLLGWKAMRVNLIENERCKTQERPRAQIGLDEH